MTSTGHLWGWGCYKDKDGKQFFDLPINTDPNSKAAHKLVKRKQSTPMQLPFFGSSHTNTVVEVATGSCFNIAMCSNGNVYSWGAYLTALPLMSPFSI